MKIFLASKIQLPFRYVENVSETHLVGAERPVQFINVPFSSHIVRQIVKIFAYSLFRYRCCQRTYRSLLIFVLDENLVGGKVPAYVIDVTHGYSNSTILYLFLYLYVEQNLSYKIILSCL